MASKASLADQQNQVQENIHSQIKTFSAYMDEILLPNVKNIGESLKSTTQTDGNPRRSGLSFAIGKTTPPSDLPPIPETNPLKRNELSQRIKDVVGYTLDLRPSQIPHKEAGTGLFLDGEAHVGSVIAIYPGVIYSPAYYRYIPGYPRVDLQNPYLITRYDGTVINAQPWGTGGETRELWAPQVRHDDADVARGGSGSDRVWKMLSKPLQDGTHKNSSDVLERRNPFAFAHFANHPPKGMIPNVMVCPYDFPLNGDDKGMRAYIPNILFGSEAEPVQMKRFGSFWFKSGGAGNKAGPDPGPGLDFRVVKGLVLVATRELCDEEVLLNYRLSNSKRRPQWYTPVDEEEDRRRWS